MPHYVEIVAVAYAQALLAWAVTFVLHAVVLLVGTALAVRVIRPRVEVEEVLWRTALLAPVVTATVRVVVGLPWGGASGGAATPMAAALGAHAGLAAVLTTGWALWVLGAAATCVARVVLERRRLRPRRPGAPDWVLDAQGSAGWAPPQVRYTTSPAIRSPVVIGAREVCLPADGLRELTLTERRAVLAHELAHVRRRDPLWRLAANVLCIVLPFQPFVRRVRRRLMELAEFACDDEAIRVTGSRRALAEALARLAVLRWNEPACAPAFTGGESRLLRRVRRLSLERHGPARTRRVLLAAVAAVLVLAGAGPAVRADPERAANTLPWLAPAAHPSDAAIDVRRRERVLRQTLRESQRRIVRRLP